MLEVCNFTMNWTHNTMVQKRLMIKVPMAAGKKRTRHTLHSLIYIHTVYKHGSLCTLNEHIYVHTLVALMNALLNSSD